MDFFGGLNGKEYAYNAGDLGLIPGSGRSPGKENGYPLQYSSLENLYSGSDENPLTVIEKEYYLLGALFIKKHLRAKFGKRFNRM